jgi:hypothetical protein
VANLVKGTALARIFFDWEIAKLSSFGSGPVKPHSTSTGKSDRYGSVVQELDFLREGPLTGAARRSGQCRGPALMEKELRGATCALPMASAMAEASRPRGPAGPNWGPCPRLRYAAPPPDVGYSKAGSPALDGTVRSARPSGVPSEARGPRGPAGPIWGPCPQLRRAPLPPGHRCRGTPWVGDWQRGAAAPFATSQRGATPSSTGGPVLRVLTLGGIQSSRQRHGILPPPRPE